MSGRIFISYRRDDAPGDARSIRDRLARKFGDSNVFMDVDNLLAGQRFDQELDKALGQCDVLVAIIGRHWMDLLSEHRRKGGRDYVREEIAAALKREIAVIPVLVGREGGLPPLPRADELPKDLRDLVLYQKHGVAHETFGRDATELIAAIGAVFRERRATGPWTGVAVGGLTGLVAGIAVLGLVVGTILWVSSRPDTPSVSATKKAADQIDAIARKGREEEPRAIGETTKSVIEGSAERRIEWYRMLAERGDAGAMDRLGSFYEEGNGVPKNSQQAIIWYRKAADAGSEEAKAKLRRLRAN